MSLLERIKKIKFFRILYYYFKEYKFRILHHFERPVPIKKYFKSNAFDGKRLYKIHEWQDRERATFGKDYSNNSKDLDESALREIRLETLIEIEYQKDEVTYNENEYWATYPQILRKAKGDCEDQAFVMMRRLLQAGAPMDKIGCAAVHYKGQGHVFCIYHYAENDFYILDNGFVADGLVKASEYLYMLEDFTLDIAFNYDSIWGYTK